MEELRKKYPSIQSECLDSVIRYYTPDVNEIVDQFIEVYPDKFELFIQDGPHKIYADPRGVHPKTDTGLEYNWLPEIVDDEINPALLVKIMRHINSHYLTDKYYQKKMPYIKEWLNKY